MAIATVPNFRRFERDSAKSPLSFYIFVSLPCSFSPRKKKGTTESTCTSFAEIPAQLKRSDARVRKCGKKQKQLREAERVASVQYVYTGNEDRDGVAQYPGDERDSGGSSVGTRSPFLSLTSRFPIFLSFSTARERFPLALPVDRNEKAIMSLFHARP